MEWCPIARDNPDSGGGGKNRRVKVVRGILVPSPVAACGDIPDNSVQPGAGKWRTGHGAEVLAQRQGFEEAIRRETERRADEIVRKMAENKPDLPDSKTEQAVRKLPGRA